ncbi:MAG: hypothetical protein AAFY08_04525 [Planctomycetota bacterium]
MAGWSQAGITELFVPEADGVGAVEWQVGSGDAVADGVTLLAVRVSGRSSAQGLIVGAWHAAVSGATVLWHDGDPTGLPRLVPGANDGTLRAIELPTFVGWDDVGWAVVAGDVTALATQLGATLASSDTRAALATTGLLAGVTVADDGAAAWEPTSGELADLGAEAGDWARATVGGPGVYRPEGAGWLGGPTTPLGAVIGEGYWFDATPAAVNGPVQYTHYPEPTTAMIVLAGGLAGLGARRTGRAGRCGPGVRDL